MVYTIWAPRTGQVCASGQHLSSGSAVCMACGSGKYLVDDDGETASAHNSEAKRVVRAVGQWRSASAAACIPCEAGRYIGVALLF